MIPMIMSGMVVVAEACHPDQIDRQSSSTDHKQLC
jgi:hypothetical protein